MICDEAMTDALVKELCSGRLLKENMQRRREIEAAAEARQMKDAKSVAGRAIGAIPQHEYFLLGHKYGMECWDDRGFIRDFFKSQSHLRAGHV